MALPGSRDATLNPGDEIPSSLMNSVQDAIIEVSAETNRRTWLFPFEGRVRALVGTLGFAAGGALESLTAMTAVGGFELFEHDRLVQVRFRVKDNGTDTWVCDINKVDQDNVSATLASGSSSGGGTWEWVTLVVGHDVEPGARYQLSIGTTNGAATSMLASGMEIATA